MSAKIHYLFAIFFAIATVVNLYGILRWMREIRWMSAARMILYSYEKELVEHGVSLPPRCGLCCQILPGHVEGCTLGKVEESAKKQGGIVDWFTRPKIKYFRDGSQPPTLKEK